MDIFILWNYIKTRNLATWAYRLCLIISLGTLVIYLLDLYYNDTFLYLLLIILRYTAFLLCTFSLYKLVLNIIHTFRRPSFSRVIKTLIYTLIIIYGAFIILMESLISVIAGGNG